MKRTRLALIVAAIGFFASSSQAATLTDDILPDLEARDLMDPGTKGRSLDYLKLPEQLALQNAQKKFSEVVAILNEELTLRADYASILKLAPEVRKYLPDDQKLLWMHALALAATGALDEAREVLALDAAADVFETSPLPHLAAAMLALRSGNTDEAARQAKQALKRDPKHAYAHNLLGTIEGRLNNMEAARKSFVEAVRYAPESPIYLRNLGLAEFARDRIQLAAQALEEALELDANDCVSLIALAQVNEASQRFSEAEKLIGRCLKSNAGEGRAAAYLIRMQLAQNRFEAALETAKRYASVLVGPETVKAEINLMMNRPRVALNGLENHKASVQKALALAMSGDLQSALNQFETIRASSGTQTPANAMAEAALSVALGVPISPETRATINAEESLNAPLAWFDALAAASSQGAAAAASAAIRADGLLPGVSFKGVPSSDWAVLSDARNRSKAALGMLWLLREYDLTARAEFNEVLESSVVQQLRYFAAIADIRLEEMQSARSKLLAASSEAPQYYSAHILLGEVELKFGRMPEALDSYRKAVEIVEDGGALLKIGVLADTLGKADIAEDALRRFIVLFPKSYIGYNQLAWVFIQREISLEEALDLANTADALQPGNASILDNIGWLHYLNGDPNLAAIPLREANRRSGSQNPDILFHLAVVEAEVGAKERSLELLNRFAKVAPANHAAAAKAKRLREQLQ
ncbi:lipoprotein NlpI [Roseovarius litorisediminis]|uniref:Lipoprotein NlpI n=1 Tax=Roseovarius litorisediminis TaxID=1312363 RepID=A0A1Y5TKH9_9RHOB|nr:tetratricopeptide repeat protein [Roseovarius litorisediminis]SLN65738.1 lipoprotein NlpI [Roseovarius litorisediminis]